MCGIVGKSILCMSVAVAGIAFCDVPFTVAEKPWPADGLGNHRAVVRVNESVRVARAILEWRRTDPQPDIKRVVVRDAATGKDVAHVVARNVTAERGEVLFEPLSGTGEYFIYYMPYRLRKGSSEGRSQPLWNDYLKPDYSEGNKWLDSFDAYRPPVEADVLRFESRTAFEAWTPMGLRATAAETDALRRAHPENPVVFTEDRTNPIHPASWLPVKWAKGVEARNSFAGTALKDEYYVWQIALWTPGGAVEGVQVKFSDLVLDSTDATKRVPPISAASITCFNTVGVNWDGSQMKIDLNVPEDRVQPLWCGVMIPPDATPGVYRGMATLSAKGLAPREISLAITVADETVRDHGDGELWRHSRLRWLNSRIGEGDTPTKPYGEMVFNREARAVAASGKTVMLAESGFPASIKVNGREVLKSPIRFAVVTEKGETEIGAGEFSLESATAGHVAWTAKSRAGGIAFAVKGRMEFDGHIRYIVEVADEAKRDLPVKDVRLIMEYTPYASEYMMGAAYQWNDGGKRPQSYSWDWKVGYYDSYWTGGPEAGLHVEFRGGAYHGPLIADRSYHYAPPQAWANGGKGRIEVGGTDGMTVVARTGETSLPAVPRKWEFDLNITPVKPLDLKKHFSQRHFHADPARFDEAAAYGANIVNIHHAQLLNPVINYPFVVQKELKDYVAAQHEKGRKVKLYYTIRELSNHVAELQTLRSLGGEIVAPGNAHGAPWLWEHVGEGYRPAWYVRMWDGSYVDAAFVLSHHSRWINYYLEGLRWMFENYKIDGIYMDDVAFDRTVMKRVCRIIEKYRPGALVDLHSNTGYSKGPMNQYTEFFPYIDRIWFGESFKYDQMDSDTRFVTFSGIPFGQMGEMLQGGGNPWLGAVYGTTRRWYGKGSLAENPGAIWKAWADFGIEDARMSGYWEGSAFVKTDSPDVKATAFLRGGKALIAVGNFSTKPRTVHLKIDGRWLGNRAQTMKLEARPIPGFQEARSFRIGEPIPIPPKRGWMLELSKRIMIHSHNDYAQKRPFWGAYETGADSIEADVFWVDGDLLVAHSRKELKKENTLRRLYLEPLREVVRKNGGCAYANGKPLQLVIDLKDGKPALDALLTMIEQEGFRECFDIGRNPSAVRLSVGGDISKIKDFLAYPDFVFFSVPSSRKLDGGQYKRVSWISDHARIYTTWRSGAMTETDKDKIRDAARHAHAKGVPYRLWGFPDNKEAWELAQELGLDYLNTDHPAAAASFLRGKDDHVTQEKE